MILRYCVDIPYVLFYIPTDNMFQMDIVSLVN